VTLFHLYVPVLSILTMLSYFVSSETSRIASLCAEIETFKAQCARLQQAENAAKSALSERLQPTLAELRRDLRAVENEFQQLAPQQAEELQQRRQEKEQEVSALEAKLAEQQEALRTQRRQQEERLEAVEQKYVVGVFHVVRTCALQR
jgi:DNA repair exonuclease SbcCD ATPase subunit